MTTPVLTSGDLAYIQNGLILLKQSIQRSSNKEIAGSEIHRYRSAQVSDIDAILSKIFSLAGAK